MSDDFKIVNFSDLSPELGTYLSLPFITSDKSGTSMLEAIYRGLQVKLYETASEAGEYPHDTQAMLALSKMIRRIEGNIPAIMATHGVSRERLEIEVLLSPPLFMFGGIQQVITQQISVSMNDTAQITYRQHPVRFLLSPEGDNWIDACEFQQAHGQTEQNASASDAQNAAWAAGVGSSASQEQGEVPALN